MAIRTKMQRVTRKDTIGTKKKVQVTVFIALAIVAVSLSACNTVRGVAQDVTDAADAIDPSK